MDKFKFPDEQEDKIEVDVLSKDDDIEIDVVDDTPKLNRIRTKLSHASRSLPTPVTTSAGTKKPFCGKRRNWKGSPKTYLTKTASLKATRKMGPKT